MIQDAPFTAAQTIEVEFPIYGRSVPCDHGHALCVSLIELPRLRCWRSQPGGIAILPIEGRPDGSGRIELLPESRLRLRIAAADAPIALRLAGQTLRVDGEDLRLGAAQTSLLTPFPALSASLVITRDGQSPEAFDDEIAQQLEDLEISARFARGEPGFLRLGEGLLGGYALRVLGLSDEDSIQLQEVGLGDHRMQGCGIFVPEVD